MTTARSGKPGSLVTVGVDEKPPKAAGVSPAMTLETPVLTAGPSYGWHRRVRCGRWSAAGLEA